VKAGNISDDYPMEDFVRRFLNADFDTPFGSWADNVGSWLAMRENSESFLFLRYEDMKQNPVCELTKVAEFLQRCSFRDVKPTPERLTRAVELSTPERMRELEKQQAGDWALTKITRQDKPFVRTAVAGGWKNVLAPQSVALLESELGPLMSRLGYSAPSGAPNTTISSGINSNL